MKYYTYAYLREDRTPYYIGKGSGKRLYRNGGRPCNAPPKNRIIFLKQNLTEEEAFKHEIYMIAVFGRKDLVTGILHNKTDGGEGSSGCVRSDELRKKISDSMKGRTFTKEHLKKISIANKGRVVSKETRNKLSMINKGKTISKETREKLSKSLTGIVFTEERRKNISKSKKGKSSTLKGKTYQEISGEHYLERIEKLRNKNIGKNHSEETKQKISNSKKGKPAWNNGVSIPSKYVYQFKNPTGKTIITRSISNLCRENNLNKTCMFRLTDGKQKQHKGWIFLSKQDISN